MIKLERGPVPSFFESPQFMDAINKLEKDFNDSERQQRLRFNVSFIPRIKAYLMENFHRKCMYCETKLGVSDEGTMDPFRPRSGARGLDQKKYASTHYWWLYYEWDNMMLSCSTCNLKYKRDFFPLEDEILRAPVGTKGMELLNEKPLLIDPCLENPEEHLSFSEDGLVSALTPKGQVTIEVLGLNRQPLIYERKECAIDLRLKLRTLEKKAIDYSVAESLIFHINKLLSGTELEYSAVQKAVFSKWYEKNIFNWERLKNNTKNISFTVPRFGQQKAVSDENLSAISETFREFKRFSIKSFKIVNFKSIKKLEINILPTNNTTEEQHRESWLLILGDNGIGKSSILQALTLALCGEKQLIKLDLEVMDFLKRGEDNGSVTVHSYESEIPVELSFDKTGFKTSISDPLTYIMSYGSTRLLPKKLIVPDPDKEPFTNVRNLFDYTISLEDPNIWLSSLNDDEFTNRVVPAFYDVLALRGDDRLHRTGGRINISHCNIDNELEDTSDGYKTVVALVSDIMQTLSGDLAGYHNTNGIVFIDEIGNHLHPRWRAKIVGALRNAFPELQFIVTTHEPLCLRGLSHGEVAVMVRDKIHEVRCLGKELLPDHSAMSIEQLLTSDLFGLIDVMDSDVEKNFEEYYELLSRGKDSLNDDEKLKIEGLKGELQAKELLGNTLREQVLFEAIDTTIAQKIREDGFKVQETLKKETVDYVKGLIQDNYKDIL
ncbi:AAA family ATPase [Flavobacterium granuli]|uniref:Energy-coupling factor transporter ATP-binding protein EcfA2 n=1 Tax=Flavobacterium granuli TaxID=280093 RepID=A0ABU1S3V0_9FLAO|nr:AAA family ATPase [Flavobacterium granuli]MDR6845680.1 energy-coupling factor transporter ATP-binding protein EcfA2 [Flavobacterium granuli]